MNKLTNQKAIDLMRELEPTFFEAANLACELQNDAVANRKNEGENEISIVTSADLAVQEFILKAILKTELIHCKILAEENTPSVEKFLCDNDLYLTLDPIDGTSNYAASKSEFALIIGLHSKDEMLYTFYHYPKFGWTTIMCGDRCEVEGNIEISGLPDNIKDSVVYSFGDILYKENDPVFQELIHRNLRVIRKKELTPNCSFGSTALFISENTAGIYVPNPLCVDGLAGLHYAKTKGYKIFSDGPDGKLDLSNITESETGNYHPGYYLTIK